MHFDKVLFDIDYLVYSSHKSATQTVAHTLRMNGYKCIHCHSLTNKTTNLEHGTFMLFLEQYCSNNARKLNIITTFREPIERHVSSFFQWHGDRAIRESIALDITETIIYKKPIKELQDLFINELENSTLRGRLESLDEIINELNLRIPDLNYSIDEQYGLIEMSYCRLFIFRFDVLINENKLEHLLSRITGKPITKHDANISSLKWYRDIYSDFKASLHIHPSIITKIYESKREILHLLYPEQYDLLYSTALDKYK